MLKFKSPRSEKGVLVCDVSPVALLLLGFFFTTFEDYIKLLVSRHISMDLCELQSRVHRSRDQIWHKMNISVS